MKFAICHLFDVTVVTYLGSEILRLPTKLSHDEETELCNHINSMYTAIQAIYKVDGDLDRLLSILKGLGAISKLF